MNVQERALVFCCRGETLTGIVSFDERRSTGFDLGLIVIVGGPQYRVGSHRQFVQLARHVAASGVPAMRFDMRGMGDSTGPLQTFEHAADDIAAAMAAFQCSVPGLRRFALWGLCDGASAALLYLEQHADERIAGVVLLNPWVRSVASEARARVKHYYLSRVLQPSFWRKLLSGKVALRAISHFARNLGESRRSPPEKPVGGESFQDRMAAGWARFRGARLLLISENDLTGREFQDAATKHPRWQNAMLQAPCDPQIVEGADHTCSSPGAKHAVEQATVRWLAGLQTA
jgi:exosortase A-associated hydrolase 1